MVILLMVLGFWISFAPLGYCACRLAAEVMEFGPWTNNDRLYAIAGSLFMGPMLLLVIGIVLILHRIDTSDWSKRKARW